MSSSTEARTVRARVVRDVDVRPAALDRDLTQLSSLVFDPARMESALADGYRSGYEQGYAEGLASGRADAFEAAKAELEDARRQLGAVLVRMRDGLAALGEQEGQLLRAVEQGIAEGAIELASAIIGHDVAACADPGHDALARAMQLVPTGVATATARLNPADVVTLGDISDLRLSEIVTVVADSEVEPGGCVLVAGDATIDAQLDSALARARARLLHPHRGLA